MHFGVREHAMGAIANGMALSYLRPFTATFLVFSDYMRPPIRLAAIMEIPTVFVFTHDSIGVGEDGPTHQPIEHLAALRAIPGLNVLRPGDANETAEAWRMAMTQTHEPSCLVLTRQALPTLDRTRYASAEGLAKGAYVLADAKDGAPQVILMATGSEVSLVLAAHERLAARRRRAPAWCRCRPGASSRNRTPPIASRCCPAPCGLALAVEQAGSIGWDRYVGLDGATITMSTFGASAPLAKLQAKYGFTVDNVCDRARALIASLGDEPMTSRLKTLGEAGQGVWLDFVDRKFLKDGGLDKLIDEDGLTGVTSNPSIFEKAMGHGDAYDEGLHAFLKTHPDATAVDAYESLAIADIQVAADKLAPVYRRLEGQGRLRQPGGLALPGQRH
jgi:hypothetical protein